MNRDGVVYQSMGHLKKCTWDKHLAELSFAGPLWKFFYILINFYLWVLYLIFILDKIRWHCFFLSKN